jgi:hypothetical protein
MDWNEMRLLEVRSSTTTSRFNLFTLYAPDKRISWAQANGSRSSVAYVPAGVTASEQTDRQAQLLSLISARAGLFPRTLSQSLQSKLEPAYRPRREPSFGAFLFTLLLLVGVTVADVLFPVTPFRWVNWASAGSLALATGAAVVSRLHLARADPTVLSPASPPAAVAPSLDTPEISYTLSWSVPPVSRLVGFFIGVCLAINLLPCGWVLRQDKSVSMGSFALGCTLGALGLIGAVLAFYAAANGTTRIHADSAGLSRYKGRRRRSIAWSSVEDITWRGSCSRQFFYLVKGEEPTSLISWLAGPPAASAGPPADGSMLIGGDELAALVAARTGQQIHVRT